MDILNYYYSAKIQGLKPTLLEFIHPIKKTPLVVCGIDPQDSLLVRDNKLYKNNQEYGDALSLFDHLTTIKDKSFFPGYLGFLSYEFSQYFELSVHDGPRTFPDAFFRFYEKGLIIDNDVIIHHDEIPLIKTKEKEEFTLQSISPVFDKLAFLDAIKSIKNTIENGDVYQVNLSTPFVFDGALISPLELYRIMRAVNPSPFMGLMEHDDWAIICGSPERLFSLYDGCISARPIAGTKKRGANADEERLIIEDLCECPKENAEHAMLVDLMRNDLHKVVSESVQVREDRSVEFYSHVMHLVSEVYGKTTCSLKDIFAAVFPGGTITGAPKKNVMRTIGLLERETRGPYTGALGYVSGWGSDFNIIIRTVLKAKDRMWCNSGAGIVIDSDPLKEWEEIHKKAGCIADILQKKISILPKRQTLVGPPRDTEKTLLAPAHVLFIENHDSFSFNIVAALKNAHAQVTVKECCDDGRIFQDYSHIVIGPGPGNPGHLPDLMKVIDQTVLAKKPLLGICLGHQAIGHYFGAVIHKRSPIHGKSYPIMHSGERLFNGVSSPSAFTRYHSLAIREAPVGFHVDAVSHDDCIMAISHKTLPIFGVQFHPESYLSSQGIQLLSNFLQVKL